ncbi:MAG: hypothetical protein GYA55_05735 [SAR324 cluster bacterium]|uniref:Uncharacterized protein n=1 Tax=SAR324 cluster bacterium TaxID=2024889 RepID=A0A7X9IL58_9DELT|nr:hypothetical protein [SAR324 cluster bacterium]
MKNFPHQFNDLEKLFNALAVAKQLIDSDTSLTDENFGEQLTRNGIYTYRDKTLSIDEFLEREQEKPATSRGYLTVSRDIRRFFELLGFITVFPDKKAKLNSAAKQLLGTESADLRKELWKNAMLQLGLEGTDGEISHPYRILLKLVNKFPGIETPKLMLALEAENDSEEEFERICNLAQLSIAEIIQETGTSEAMAANAVKILPGIADQLDDIDRIASKAYPVGHIVVTEDEISTEEEYDVPTKERATYREVGVDDIAKDPTLKVISSVSIDLSDAIKTRQDRLSEHQEIVRLLAILNDKCGFKLFEGKFDCLGIKENSALLYEVKTILETATDQEKQTVKGVGQLKYYKFSIVQQQMGISDIKEILVFSRKPDAGIIDFCTAENIAVIWREGDSFEIYNVQTGGDDSFNPDGLL